MKLFLREGSLIWIYDTHLPASVFVTSVLVFVTKARHLPASGVTQNPGQPLNPSPPSPNFNKSKPERQAWEARADPRGPGESRVHHSQGLGKLFMNLGFRALGVNGFGGLGLRGLGLRVSVL